MNNGVLKVLGFLATAGCLALSTGCAHIDVTQIDVNRMAYEVLSQEDCRINELEDFCTRNFSREYREYELLRREFMRSQKQNVWRVSMDESTLRSASLN